ncbi:multifunctional CCA addition/repair protein [Candidatus Erwinia haradaeae]|uniref:CCA-adding enzyme n=1 Tax=Candidatus Erwinia haradaeae TaxID=1922217 RepID=A0A451D2A1_9GAMM|nr:multifunctional CCA addition/repair protein [Candidatus Erwinia haradaeae]VFP79747.1 Multifunctional CCA protein [Candidatus Erwinia haradaeae]
MEIYLVGGAVRNKILNLPLKDKDWVVVGGTPQQMLDLGYKQVGRDFPVFINPKTHEEYALARTERKTGHGYNGFICDTAPNVTLQQDLARRDLTINAIAQDQHGLYYDPYGGCIDLYERRLRHVSPAFNEDPLRVLRVARFAAFLTHLNFRISDKTFSLMKEIVNSGELVFLTGPRVWKEIENALKTNYPQVFFKVLRDCGAFSILFPELDSILNIFNVRIDDALKTLANVSQYSLNLETRFAALFYGFNKILRLRENFIFNNQDEMLGIHKINQLCKRLNVPNSFRNFTLLVTEFHEIINNVQYMSSNKLIHFFKRMDARRHPLRIQQISLIFDSETNTKYPICEINSNIYKEYLSDAWKVINSISVQEIVRSGLIGKNIGDELLRRQNLALIDWKRLKKNK